MRQYREGGFYGKYQGIVKDNADPHNLGRIKASVEGFYEGEDSPWALPCLPYAGPGVGFFFVPPVKAHVWIEFLNGDSGHPIWTGCYWAEGEKTPGIPERAEQTKIIKTKSVTLTLDDFGGSEGVTIETTSGLKIIMKENPKIIELSSGDMKVTLEPGQVSINGDALVVT